MVGVAELYSRHIGTLNEKRAQPCFAAHNTPHSSIVKVPDDRMSVDDTPRVLKYGPVECNLVLLIL